MNSGSRGGTIFGGTKDFEQVPRPGFSKLDKQAQDIFVKICGQSVSVAEDDIFSGGSVIASLQSLKQSGIGINKVISGIQIGKPKKLSDMGLVVDPVYEYYTSDGVDIFSKLDLGDPRDYLLGASGLVTKLPNGEFGRAPYILPFVSTTARAGIPANIEKEFALKVLKINANFFGTIDEKTEIEILLKHMDKSFQRYMNQMFGIDLNTKMEQLSMWLMENIDVLWESIKNNGELQEKLGNLNLPSKIVFLDVNGTLFSDESTDGYIEETDLSTLKLTVSKLNESGISVGICSDSPLKQLELLAIKIGVNGPIIAENGNLISYSGKVLKFNSLEHISELKQQISEISKSLGYVQQSDCIAQEFGGTPIETQSINWGFGANRETSITVFGPSLLITKLGELFKSNQQKYSVDCTPEYNCFAIHPGNNFKENKGKTLNVLSAFGHSILMVGNSMSDWVDLENGVISTFVAESRINESVTNKAKYISDKPLVKGVINILEKIS